VLDSQEISSKPSTKVTIEVHDGPVTPQPVPPGLYHPLEGERVRVQPARFDNRHSSGAPPPGLRRVGPEKRAGFWRWR
jgi:hypothetical protein